GGARRAPARCRPRTKANRRPTWAACLPYLAGAARGGTNRLGEVARRGSSRARRVVWIRRVLSLPREGGRVLPCPECASQEVRRRDRPVHRGTCQPRGPAATCARR